MENLYQSLVAVEPTTLIVTVLNLFVQLYLIKRFFLSKILKVLEQRQELTQQQLQEAQNAKEEALSLKESYEKHEHQAREEAVRLVEQAKKTAEDRSEQILREARQQAEQLRQKAHGDIVRQRDQAVRDAKNQLSELAVAIAQRVIGNSLGAADQARLVDGFIDELGGV